MGFRKLYGWLLGATVVFTLACFGASLFFATQAGAAGKFPGSLFEAFMNTVSPMTEIHEEEKLELQGLREFLIDVGSVDLEVSLLEEGVASNAGDKVSPPSAPKGANEVAVLKLSGKEIVFDHSTPAGEPVPHLIAAHRNGDVFEVTVRSRSGLRFDLNSNETKPLALQLQLPPSFNGRLRIQSGSGDVRILKVAKLRQLRVRSGSGSILVEEGEIGSADLASASGEIDFRALSLDIRAEASSGDINLDTPNLAPEASEAPQRIDLSTSSGDISIALNERSSLDVELHTSSGDISSEFPEIKVNEDARDVRGRVGTALGRLTGRTVSGDLTLSKLAH